MYCFVYCYYFNTACVDPDGIPNDDDYTNTENYNKHVSHLNNLTTNFIVVCWCVLFYFRVLNTFVSVKQ